MRVRIERKLNLKCAAMTELYIDGKREYVAEITPDVPLSEINIPVHMESERIWIEFEADIEVLEKRTDYGTTCRVAMVRNIHDCVIGGKDD
jgi:hypothetical protein